MLINNTEALKSWLIIVLEPLCDADSSALARYVLALLKKDKPEKDLKRVMIEQLDVFLGEETEPFVEKLFNAINSEEYLKESASKNYVASKTSENASEAVATSPAGIESDNALLEPDLPNSSINDDCKLIEDENPPIVITDADEINKPPVEEQPKTKDTPIHHKPTIVSSEPIENQRNSVQPYTPTVKTETLPNSQGFSHNHQVRSASPPAVRASATAADKENQPRDSRRRRASLRSRSRSRTRSNERPPRRSRSRERARISERERNQRQFRNKSPPSDLRYERRRGGANGGLDRRRIGNNSLGNNLGERSPRYGPAIENANRKMRTNRSRTRSRSGSLERNRNKTSPGGSRVQRNSPDRTEHRRVRETQMVVANDNHQRCRDFDEKGYCVRGETCPWDHGVNPVVFEGIGNPALMSMSMREYNPDSPDLWSRSTTATTSMVATAAIVNVTSTISTQNINPFSGTARPTATIMPQGAVVNVSYPPHIAGAPAVDKTLNGALPSTEYVRNAAGGAGFRAAAPIISYPFNPAGLNTPLQRELIPIPVVDASNSTAGGEVSTIHPAGKRRFELEDSVAIADGPTKRKIPPHNRLGPRVPNTQSNCSLELRKVPRGMNTIAHLNNHFAKFGKIVNIQVSYEGDPEAAIVTFSTHAEANVAYRSTEAVLNNRFIKVFWHQDSNASNDASGIVPPTIVRKNSQYHLNNVPAIPAPPADSAKISNSTIPPPPGTTIPDAGTNGTTAPTLNSEGKTSAASTSGNIPAAIVTATHVPPASLRTKNNLTRNVTGAPSATAFRKMQEDQAKAVVNLAHTLRKRKQELLQSYVKQLKSACELVERCEPNDPQRVKTLTTVKVLQETIDKLRAEISVQQLGQMQSQIQNQQSASPAPKRTKEQQKKELLDIELELFAQQQEGADTTAIQKRLEELQRSLGITTTTPNHHSPHAGKPSFYATNHRAPRGRSVFPEGPTRIDRRPKTIVITGFASEESELVLAHFKHYGDVTKHDMDKEIPQLIISYATRINAEQAILRGKVFKEKRLQISWAPVITKPNEGVSALTESTEKSSLQNSENKAPITTKLEDGIKPKTISEASDSITSPDAVPELRLEDEEEDDESEDRSWRR